MKITLKTLTDHYNELSQLLNSEVERCKIVEEQTSFDSYEFEYCFSITKLEFEDGLQDISKLNILQCAKALKALKYGGNKIISHPRLVCNFDNKDPIVLSKDVFSFSVCAKKQYKE